VAQLGRRLNCDVVNLGFSGSGRGEPIMAEMMLEIDASIYIVDCVANMPPSLMNSRYENFVNQLRAAKPDIPIVLMTKNHYAKEIVEGSSAYDDQHAALFTTYSNLIAQGDQNLYLFDTGALIPAGGDHPSADGTHLTDEGFTRIADGLEPVLGQILQGLETPPPTYVLIGDTNNVADTTGYGAVGYAYKIAQNAVTIEQFYHSGVGSGDENYWNDGTRTVGWDAPATMVTWNEAAKYCNWLTSGSPTNGAYQFDATGNTLTAVDRDTALATYGTVYAIPTEDEWYKAAYYTGSGYSLYPFGTDTPPLGGTNANPQANVFDGGTVNPSPNYLWKVGSGTMEQNGTYDMVGNAWEWIESAFDGTLDDMTENRVMRGGAYDYYASWGASTKRISRALAPSNRLEFRPVQLGLTPMETWAADYGLSGTNATASADPDGDTLDNLGEYGLGGDPTNPADQGIPPTYAMDQAGGSNWVTYVYPKRSNLDSGLTYYLETSTNLVSGTWINDGYNVVGTGAIDPEFNAVTNQVPTEPERKKFIRLVIEG
jgi:formylglycine-generating enzyme required for sulfatase activity